MGVTASSACTAVGTVAVRPTGTAAAANNIHAVGDVDTRTPDAGTTITALTGIIREAAVLSCAAQAACRARTTIATVAASDGSDRGCAATTAEHRAGATAATAAAIAAVTARNRGNAGSSAITTSAANDGSDR
ncbi:hypothetical protein GCM10007874_44740 [Labrys miyagiensis]|uniref:Uncharacterized protein n=1 Tax=Labrys miyagiensis TaxID=346912 RepID=A0ABQ6CPD4_9HYPH|nr:hypothetical protein GCM10007874_44740 [Labrys miyagiensis]